MPETMQRYLIGTRAAVIRKAAASNAYEHRILRHWFDPRHVLP